MVVAVLGIVDVCCMESLCWNYGYGGGVLGEWFSREGLRVRDKRR